MGFRSHDQLRISIQFQYRNFNIEKNVIGNISYDIYLKLLSITDASANQSAIISISNLNFIKVCQITTRWNDQTNPTKHMILTVNNSTLPKKMKVTCKTVYILKVQS